MEVPKDAVENGCSKEPPTRLHVMFDKLNVSSEISYDQLKENCLLTVDKTKDEAAQSAVDIRKSPSKCAMKHRSKPYSKDNLPFNDQSLLPAMNELSFKKEKCLNKHCQCNVQHAVSDVSEKPCDNLSFAKACRDSRVVLHEPRLKLHHAQKDHRVVLRAARLKLAAKSTLHQLHKPLISSTHAMKPSTINRSSVFGLVATGSKNTSKDFSSLAQEAKTEKREGNLISFKPESFRQCHHKRRATSPSVQIDRISKQQLCDCDIRKSASELDLSQLGLVLPHCGEDKPSLACPIHPDLCPRPNSCSMQASRVDDCTMDELACYFDDLVYIPKKMSAMAEMMYT